MLELYHALISTCSQKVRLVLAEKQLEWRSHEMLLHEGQHLTDEYLKLNPNGVVPTLVDDGNAIVDSSVIIEYLEDMYPSHPVRPQNPVDVAKMRAWRQYIDEVPTAAIRVPSFNAHFVPIWAGLTDEEFAEYTDKLPLRKHFYQKMSHTTGFSEADMKEAREKLRQTLCRMEQSLSLGPWLIGSMYTIADVAITPTIVRMEDLGLSHMWHDLPHVSDWYSRIKSRPNFEAAYIHGSRDLDPINVSC